MPLVLLSGFPSSGKSKRAAEIKDYLEAEKGKTVFLVSENDALEEDKNGVFSDSQREKEVRGRLKAEVLRRLSKEDVVVLDSANYIKGYRYELYCASKQYKTPQCLVHTPAPIEEAWGWNLGRGGGEQYHREVFDGLVARYEAPNSSNRWDSPMFTVLPPDPPPLEDIYSALFLTRPPPPNQSTQTQPLSSTNFLYELDRSTQEVTKCVMAAQKTATPGEAIRVPGVAEALSLGRTITLPELTRARRQFIAYTKMHPVEDPQKIMLLFVQYLNSTLG
ncbi:Protein KTI12 [Chionoecetes opilio]|uniref:Protein KTI12 homolog n=1 Tax=Chionoecetes opilio TaxID=41210 RepID=A0A8J5CFT4_CHIOP|nr:Protein KTI12 [Chionoecetes opilio]